MCTATWLRQSGGYHLFHNRDELRTRLPALPPRIHLRDGVQVLAPIDADAGGTWIGVNEFKLAACLLNRYDQIDPRSNPSPYTSRGQLVMHVLGAAHIEQAIGYIEALSLAHFQPFTLVLLYPDMPVCLLEWNGRVLAHIGDAGIAADAGNDADTRLPLVSSSYDQVGASQLRHTGYVALATPHTPQTLAQYHASHGDHGPDALSVCMSRADAHTVSFTHIEVGPNLTQLTYHPGPPCEAADDIVLFL